MYKGCEIDNYMLFDICFINYSILHGITGAGNTQCTKFPQTPIYTINIIPRFVVNWISPREYKIHKKTKLIKIEKLLFSIDLCRVE